MRLGKRILGLLAGIMCFGALASCNKGNEPQPTENKATIETIYYCDAGNGKEASFSEVAYSELSKKEFTDKYWYFTIAFKPNKEVVVKGISATISGGVEGYEGKTVVAYSNVLEKRSGNNTNIIDNNGIKYESLGNNLSYTLNVTVSTDKYFEFIFLTGDNQSFSNVKITFEEVK